MSSYYTTNLSTYGPGGAYVEYEFDYDAADADVEEASADPADVGADADADADEEAFLPAEYAVVVQPAPFIVDEIVDPRLGAIRPVSYHDRNKKNVHDAFEDLEPVRTHKSFHRGWFPLCQDLYADFDVTVNNLGRVQHLPFERLSNLTFNMSPGNFGRVFTATLRDADDCGSSRTVFVKEQPKSRQYCAEIGTSIAAFNAHIPAPTVLGLLQPPLHVTNGSRKVWIVYELSPGASASEGAAKVSLEQRHVFAVAFAFIFSLCHASGVIHNDIALRNLLTDWTHLYKVIDFGLSVVVPEGNGDNVRYPYPHAQMAVLMAAPEMLEARVCSTKTDVFQFGWMLYELYTGVSFIEEFRTKLPQRAASFARDAKTFVDAVSTIRPAPPSEDVCPASVFSLILECLDANPERRPSMRSVCTRLVSSLPTPSLPMLADVVTGAASFEEALTRAYRLGATSVQDVLETSGDAHLLRAFMLGQAVIQKDLTIAKNLIAHHPRDANSQALNFQTALSLALENDDYDMLQLFLTDKSGEVDFAARNNIDCTILHEAIQKADEVAFDLIMQAISVAPLRHAKVFDVSDVCGRLPLHAAARTQPSAVATSFVTKLLASLDEATMHEHMAARDRKGRTPLLDALQHGNQGAVEAMLSRCSCSKCVEQDSRACVLASVESGNTDLYHYARTRWTWTPVDGEKALLTAAAKSGSLEMVQAVLVSCSSSSSDALLDVAFECGSPVALRAALEHADTEALRSKLMSSMVDETVLRNTDSLAVERGRWQVYRAAWDVVNSRVGTVALPPPPAAAAAADDLDSRDTNHRCVVLGPGHSGRRTLALHMAKRAPGHPMAERAEYWAGQLMQNLVDGAKEVAQFMKDNKLLAMCNPSFRERLTFLLNANHNFWDSDPRDSGEVAQVLDAVEALLEEKLFRKCLSIVADRRLLGWHKPVLEHAAAILRGGTAEYPDGWDWALTLRMTTIGVTHNEVACDAVPLAGSGGMRLSVVYAGGQRVERHKWKHCFPDGSHPVTFFTASVLHRTEVLWEDERVSALDDSLSCLEFVVKTLESSPNVPIVVVLTQVNMLASRLRAFPWSMPGFEGDPLDVGDVVAHLKQLYLSASPRVVAVLAVDSLDEVDVDRALFTALLLCPTRKDDPLHLADVELRSKQSTAAGAAGCCSIL